VEEWREIQEFDLYLVSDLGNVRRIDRENNRKLYLNAQGFPCIVLFRDPIKTRYVRQVNKLVATAFIPPSDDYMATSVWHKDGDLLNCMAQNLKWERRDRVMEWNEMNRRGTPKYHTPPVRVNASGEIYETAYHAGLATGEIESAVMYRIQIMPDQYADQGKYMYVEA
jgi:hypothetical protein